MDLTTIFNFTTFDVFFTVTINLGSTLILFLLPFDVFLMIY